MQYFLIWILGQITKYKVKGVGQMSPQIIITPSVVLLTYTTFSLLFHQAPSALPFQLPTVDC